MLVSEICVKGIRVNQGLGENNKQFLRYLMFLIKLSDSMQSSAYDHNGSGS